LAVSALIFVSFTAWNATSRFSAPISSRTLPTSACATVSSTPGSNRAPRSSPCAQNRHPRLVFGRAHVHHQPARQPRDQPLVQVGDFGGGRSLVSTI